MKLLKNPEVLVRLLADFAIVHAAALASLMGVLVWRLIDTPGINGAALAGSMRMIYLTRFAPLSLIFPIVFMASGFYSRARSFRTPLKWRTIATGAGVATLVYLFADFVIDRADVIPRSSTLLFLMFVVAGTVGARLLKHWLVSTRGERAPSPPRGASSTPAVLVVGGAGYIGSLLCEKLLQSGYRVRVLDSLIYGNAAIAEFQKHPQFELIPGDCRNIQSVVSAVRGVDSIVHLAAIVGDPACEQDRQTALEINYAATRMLIEIARGHCIERLVFASSCSIYGASDQPMSENSAPGPISLYAQTKLDSERALLEARTADFHPTILRLATVFGYSLRPRFDLVTNLLVAKAFSEGTITIFNGEQWRPFIHVADVVRGVILALESPLALVSGQIFNLGDARLNSTLSGLAEKIRLKFPETRVQHIQNSDLRNYRVSFAKVRQELGFECEASLEDGIREMKSVFEQGLIADYRSPQYHNHQFLQQTAAPLGSHGLDRRVMAAFSDALPVAVRHAAAGD